MVTREDVESYLLRMQLEFEEVEPGMWIVQNGGNSASLVVNHVPPLKRRMLASLADERGVTRGGGRQEPASRLLAPGPEHHPA